MQANGAPEKITAGTCVEGRQRPRVQDVVQGFLSPFSPLWTPSMVAWNTTARRRRSSLRCCRPGQDDQTSVSIDLPGCWLCHIERGISGRKWSTGREVRWSGCARRWDVAGDSPEEECTASGSFYSARSSSRCVTASAAGKVSSRKKKPDNYWIFVLRYFFTVYIQFVFVITFHWSRGNSREADMRGDKVQDQIIKCDDIIFLFK